MEALPIISPAGELQKTTAARFSSSISFLHCLDCNKKENDKVAQMLFFLYSLNEKA